MRSPGIKNASESSNYNRLLPITTLVCSQEGFPDCPSDNFPDFSYDGLEFKDGIWHEIRDVDVRNPSY